MGYFSRAKRYYGSAKRKSRRFKKWYNTPQTPKALAIQALRKVRYIKGLVNSEMFHIDKSYSSNTISGSGYIYNLTGIAQGDGINGRTGNSLLVRNLNWRLKFEINSSVTVDTSIMMAIVQDNQQQSDTDPQVTDIFASATPEALLATGNFGRFKILYRKTFILTPASGGRPAVEMVKYKNLYHHVRYNGVNATDIQKGGLYVVFVGSESTNLPTVTGTIRLGYHDN